MIRAFILDEMSQGFMEARRGREMFSCQNMSSCVLPNYHDNIDIGKGCSRLPLR